MALHNDLGKKGEKIAENYLQNIGYEIVARNWRCTKGEIDLILTKDQYVVFVEVKTRSSSYWGNPEEAVTSQKVKRMVEVADYFLSQNDFDLDVRFDIVSIVVKQNTPQIHHFPDAFVAPIT